MYLFRGKHAPICALLFRILGLLTGITAITLQLFTNNIVGKGFMANHVLAYFTLQTNIFTTLMFLALIIKTIIDYHKTGEITIASLWPSLHLATTFYITITMTVYWGVLSFMVGVGDTGLTIANTLFLHLFTPLMAILDCLFFFKHGSLKIKEAIKWLIYPTLYIISLIIIANVSEVAYYKFPFKGEVISLMYPYPFLDPQVVGLPGMIIVIILLMIIVTGFGLLYVFIDNKIAKCLEHTSCLKL